MNKNKVKLNTPRDYVYRAISIIAARIWTNHLENVTVEMQREYMKRARDSTDSSSDADLPQKRSRHHSPPPLGTIRALSSFFKSSRDSLNSSTSTLNLDGKFDLFHTACGQSLWQGDRTENQDQIYVDDNFDVEQFKHFLIHTEKEVLKHLTSSWDLPESLRNSAKIESCNSFSVTAVFDGHGPAGLSASSLAREFLPQYLQLNSPILCLGRLHFNLLFSISHSRLDR